MTVTATVASTPSTDVLAVIVAVPSATKVIKPFSSTVATASFELDQVTVLSSASAGSIVAVICFVPPTLPVAVFWLNVIPVTSTGSLGKCDYGSAVKFFHVTN